MYEPDNSQNVALDKPVRRGIKNVNESRNN